MKKLFKRIGYSFVGIALLLLSAIMFVVLALVWVFTRKNPVNTLEL